jgi:hypothetical protein
VRAGGFSAILGSYKLGKQVYCIALLCGVSCDVLATCKAKSTSSQFDFCTYIPTKVSDLAGDMSDIDDELLALAGGASSDEEDDAPTNINKEASDSPNNRGTGKSSMKKSASRKGGRRSNDSEEEGEA